MSAGGGNNQEFQTADMRKAMGQKDKGTSELGDAADAKPTTLPPSASKRILYPRPSADPYDMRKYFVTRAGAFDQAMEDLKAHVNANMGERAHSFWLVTEIDHWNNEKERVLVVTDSALLICKYDFIMLKCLQLQRVPLNYIDRIIQGSFAFPERSLDRREGEGLRIFWDQVREPTFLSRWNPWSTDLPYATFTEHPVKNNSERFATICQISTFTAQLLLAVENAQRKDPVPGRMAGVVMVNEPIPIETYAGLMAFLGNRNKLGYSLARGFVGF